MMDIFAVVDGTGTIVNVVAWDGGSDWSPPEGCQVVEISTEPGSPGIGWTGTESGGNWTWTPPAD